jgi:hypothetical protein
MVIIRSKVKKKKNITFQFMSVTITYSRCKIRSIRKQKNLEKTKRIRRKSLIRKKRKLNPPMMRRKSKPIKKS